MIVAETVVSTVHATAKRQPGFPQILLKEYGTSGLANVVDHVLHCNVKSHEGRLSSPATNFEDVRVKKPPWAALVEGLGG